MRLTWLLLLGFVGIPFVPALAQEASVRETRCWIGDVAFSAGAGLNAGDGAMMCKAGVGWVATEADAPVAGCLLEGKLSSAGAVVGVRNRDDVLLQCGHGGSWAMIEAGAGE